MQYINFSLDFTRYYVQFFLRIINSNLQFYPTYVNNIYLSFMLLFMNPFKQGVFITIFIRTIKQYMEVISINTDKQIIKHTKTL